MTSHHTPHSDNASEAVTYSGRLADPGSDDAVRVLIRSGERVEITDATGRPIAAWPNPGSLTVQRASRRAGTFTFLEFGEPIGTIRMDDPRRFWRAVQGHLAAWKDNTEQPGPARQAARGAGAFLAMAAYFIGMLFVFGLPLAGIAMTGDLGTAAGIAVTVWAVICLSMLISGIRAIARWADRDE